MGGKKILVASMNPWAFCMAVEADVARSHAGDRVDLVNMYRLCSRYSPHWRPLDRAIEAVNRKIERFVRPAINGEEITGRLAATPVTVPPVPETFEALRGYKLEGAHIGLGVLSSVTSVTTIREPTHLDEYGSALPRAWDAAHRSFHLAKAIAAMSYDEIWVFNGRHCYARPFCDVLERSATVMRYEQGSTGNSYVAADRMVFDPEVFARLVRANPFDPALGEAFYRERLERVPGNEAELFTGEQIPGYLPVEGERIVSFFTSSTDEMYSVKDEPTFGVYARQSDAALAVAEQCSRLGYRLVIRMHPHLQYKSDAWRREWDFEALAKLGTMVVEPADPCDSYALVRASHCVFTVGSSVGVEAAYLGVPNAVVGLWTHGPMGTSAVVRDAGEIAAFISDPVLPDGAHEAALRYGSFCKRAGKLLPELRFGDHPNLATIDGRPVDPVRYAVQKLRVLAGVQQNNVLSSSGKMIVEQNLKVGREGFKRRAAT